MSTWLTLINQNQIDVENIVAVVGEGLKMERLNRDAQKLLGNHREFLQAELKIAQTELFLHALRYGGEDSF
jgi:hypothetical protein